MQLVLRIIFLNRRIWEKNARLAVSFMSIGINNVWLYVD